MKKYESSQAEYQGEARWVPGCQVPGFPGEQDDCPLGSWWPGPWVPCRRRGEGGDQEFVKRRRRRSRRCQEEEEIKILSRKFVSKWLKWKLGRRPGHRSIWTVFVFDGYDLFPSFRLWWR